MKKLLRPLFYLLVKYYKEIGLIFRVEKYDSKVFCIGFNKTGTTSLGKAFEMLGYRNSTFNRKVWRQYYLKDKIVPVLRYTAKFDSLDDLPWLQKDMIPLLDRVFPNSKFVYLTREEAAWKKSYTDWRYKVFGEHVDIEKVWKEYQDHNAFVMEYFKSATPEKFLLLDIKDENGFQKLADFLGKETSIKKFPHINRTSELPDRT